MADKLKQAEETKRERAWSAAERWRVVQETITWAESQSTVNRNTPAARRAEERRKLALAGRPLSA